MRKVYISILVLVFLLLAIGVGVADYISIKAHDVTSDNGALSGFGSITLGGETRTEWGTVSYDNVAITGGYISTTTITLIDNSVVPAKLRHITTPDNTLFYRGDGEWADPGVDAQSQLDAKQPLDADLTVLSFPTPWRVFYSNGARAITEQVPGDNNTCWKSTGPTSAPSWGACGTGSGTTTLPWDNITSRPTIGGVTVTGAILDNASNYPTLNQNTSGTAANLSGTPNLPNGVTTTSQAEGDNSTKLSTTLYVDRGLAAKAPILNPVFTNNITVDNTVVAKQIETDCTPSDNNCFINFDNEGDVVSPVEGTIGFNRALSMLRRYNGSSWDNVGGGGVATISDNSVAPIKLQSNAGTRDSDNYYRGDGRWAIPPTGITVVDTAPVAPTEGDAWLLTSNNTLYVRGAAGTYSYAGFSYTADNTSEGASYADSFNRSNADPVGGNWSTQTTASASQILSLELACRTASECRSYWSNGAFTDNQYSQVTLSVAALPAGEIGPCVRMGLDNGYCAVQEDSTTTYIYKIVAGSASALTTVTNTYTNGDVLKLTATGGATTTLTLYKNGGSIGSTADSSSAITSGVAGVFMSGSTVRVDDWIGGDL